MWTTRPIRNKNKSSCSCDDSVVHERVINGTRAFIDPRWKKRSYIESKLVEVMEQCWIRDTSKRLDIFQVVNKLNEIVKETSESRNAYSRNAYNKAQSHKDVRLPTKS